MNNKVPLTDTNLENAIHKIKSWWQKEKPDEKINLLMNDSDRMRMIMLSRVTSNKEEIEDFKTISLSFPNINFSRIQKKIKRRVTKKNLQRSRSAPKSQIRKPTV